MAGHYLKRWRQHRNYTQEQVTDRLVSLDDPLLPTTAASLSRLENGKQPYSERILEALAEIYQCEADHLIGRDPTKEGEVIDLLARLNESQLQQAKLILQALQGAVA